MSKNSEMNLSCNHCGVTVVHITRAKLLIASKFGKHVARSAFLLVDSLKASSRSPRGHVLFVHCYVLQSLHVFVRFVPQSDEGSSRDSQGGLGSCFLSLAWCVIYSCRRTPFVWRVACGLARIVSLLKWLGQSEVVLIYVVCMWGWFCACCLNGVNV